MSFSEPHPHIRNKNSGYFSTRVEGKLVERERERGGGERESYDLFYGLTLRYGHDLIHLFEPNTLVVL